MNNMINAFTLRPTNKVVFKLGMVLAMLAGLMGSLAFPVLADAAPVITPVSVIPGSYVQVRISNLPVDTDFTVSEGLAGTQGFGGSPVAGFNSDSGGTQTFTFEIVTALAEETSLDIRVESLTGVVAWATFNNTAPVAVASGSGGAAAVPVTGATAVVNATLTNQIQVTRDKAGGVATFLISNLPLDTNYLVTIGPAGSGGVGGYVVANLYTGDQSLNVGTFEIPVLLEGSAKLDLRLDGPNSTLIKTFSNVDTTNMFVPQ